MIQNVGRMRKQYCLNGTVALLNEAQVSFEI